MTDDNVESNCSMIENNPPKRVSLSDLICIFAMSIVGFSCFFCNTKIMASISKNIFDIYSSTFYQCVVIISLIIILGYMILGICTGSFYYKNALINIWALITCLTYIIGKNNKYKYIIMWIVLFSQIMLALWVAK